MTTESTPGALGSNAGLGATWGEYADACRKLHDACERVRTTLAVMDAKERNEAAAKLPDAPAVDPAASSSSYSSESADEGTLSGDESLAALRDQLKSAE